MTLTKRERIEGNKIFTRLIGEGFEAKPVCKGGLFECPASKENISHSVQHIKEVISHLPEEDVNSVGALMFLLRDAIAHERLRKESTYLVALSWLDHPRLTQENREKAFGMMCNSFANTKQAIAAKKFYVYFLRTCDNPWTQENAQKPGFAVLPYFKATDERFPDIVPMHNKDQRAYKKEVANVLGNRKFMKLSKRDNEL